MICNNELIDKQQVYQLCSRAFIVVIDNAETGSVAQ